MVTKKEKSAASPEKAARRVDLLGIAEILNSLLEESLYQEVYQELRTNQRERLWTFKALAQFWMSVVLEAPQSLTQMLSQAQEGTNPLLPWVGASPEAFFERCQSFSWRFFAKLYQRFKEKAVARALPLYAQALQGLRGQFPEIIVVDGSKLEQVVHRLGILRKVPAAVLPGMLVASYDLFRGILRDFLFEPHASAYEPDLSMDLLEKLPGGSLVLADRLYGKVGFFQTLHLKGLWGLIRRHKNGGCLYKVELLSREQFGGRQTLEDWKVEFGRPASPKLQTLRWIVYRKGSSTLELLTNVLESERLSATQALQLYHSRWSIERVFFELKEVLGLNTLYTATPNACGLHAYAAAIVHTALKMAQGEIAQEHGRAPEEISPAKLFPKMAKACEKQAWLEWHWWEVVRANPGVVLTRPSLEGKRPRWFSTTLKAILVETKTRPRSRGKPNTSNQWLSFAHIKGGAVYLRN